tara:strand:- start:90 stop:815 length:726 start_codon:yes stop_codon:yes gene_type:complete
MTKIIIPARIKSTRLPEKVLKDVEGVPLFVVTANKAIEIIGRKSVIVATDSIKVLNTAKKFNIQCEITSDKCLTGSDRVVSLAKEKGIKKVINLQADEPLFPLSSIKKMINYVENNHIKGVLAGYEFTNNNEKYMSLKVPKMLISSEGNLIYTSRHPLPASKISNFSKFGNIQVCIYAYNIDNVLCFQKDRNKGYFEDSEDLELLACIENNVEVKCIELENSPFSIDTEEDYQKLRNYIKK